MIVKCPNCGHEFIVDDDKIIGNCPRCHIKLAFKRGNEKIEIIDIKEIEKRIDSIPGVRKKADIDIVEIEEKEGIESRVDEIIE